METVAIGYVRVSTKGQADSGISLDAQKDKIKAYCDLYEFRLHGVLEDPGESAGSLERPGLEECLRLLSDPDEPVNAIIVVKLDRLTRSVTDLGQLLKDYFSDGKNHLISVGETIDTTSAGGRLMVNILTSVAQWERETIGERTSAALQHMRENGQYTGGHVRYGYRLDGDKKLAQDPREQEVIGIAKTLHQNEELSLSAIARFLNDRGYQNRKGGDFQAVQIRKMLDELPVKPKAGN